MNAFPSAGKIPTWSSLALLVLLTGCKPKPDFKPVSELQRKQADHLVAEANFAINLRDWAGAEKQLAEAAKLAPDTGRIWTALGSVRVRAGNKAGAKDAYQNALAAYKAEADKKENKDNPDPWIKQVQMLALLGRISDARDLLAKAEKNFPTHRTVRGFVDGKLLDKMLANPVFKQDAL